ncbi:MAG: CHAT domain-containing protein, partial [Acidimicrobiia bacterium]|nr:CHAT domain-containing protein [Acidimicrobiia bacterium]
GDVGRGADRGALEAAAIAAARALERFDLDEVPAHRRRAANTLGAALAQLEDWSAAAEAYLLAAEAAETLAAVASDPRKELADASSAHLSAAHALARAGSPLAAAAVVEQSRARLTSDRPVVANRPESFLGGDPLGAADLREAVTAAGTLVYVVPTDDGSVGVVLRNDEAAGGIAATTVVADQLRSADLRRLIAAPVLGHGRGGHTRGRLAQAQPAPDPFVSSPDDVLVELAERLAPVTAALGDDDGVVIVSCGRLGIVPLQALWLERPPGAASPRELVHAPSAAMHAAAARSRRRPVSRLVAVGINEFDDHPSLLAAEQEARWIAGLPFDDVELITGRDATPERLREKASTATHLHIATHGVFSNTGDPQASGLYCAGGTFLPFADLLAEDLGSLELVTSSACWSGLHDVLYLPDEVDGLSTSLLRRGARAVVVPSWAVSDLDAACFMVKLYELHRLKGYSVAAATAAAQIWLRDLAPAERAAFIHQRALLAPSNGAATTSSRDGSQPPGSATWAAFRYIGA